MNNEIVRIKEVYQKEGFKIYCLFTNNEGKVIDFEHIFKEWNVSEGDIEYPLLNESEFEKVKLVNGTLCWENVQVTLLDKNKQEQHYPYDLDPMVLYQLATQVPQSKNEILEAIYLLYKTLDQEQRKTVIKKLEDDLVLTD